MDEPFGALDAQTRAIMQDLVLDIRKREHTTTLFITHDIDEAVYLSDRIFVMTARPGKFKAEINVPSAKSATIRCATRRVLSNSQRSASPVARGRTRRC
jgi:NitT/TauT family transport system ATP-binding protein